MKIKKEEENNEADRLNSTMMVFPPDHGLILLLPVFYYLLSCPHQCNK